MSDQKALLEKRYDLRDNPSNVQMSGKRKAVQQGVRVKLHGGATWDTLGGMTPEQIKQQNAVPDGLPAAAAREASRWAAWCFRKQQIDEIKKQEARDLQRFDVDFDLPDHLTPEFPPPMFLTSRPDLGDVTQGRGAHDQELLPAAVRQGDARADGRHAAAADAESAAAVQSDRRPQGEGAEPGRDVLRLPRERPHERHVPRESGYAAAGRPDADRNGELARHVQSADSRLEAVAALDRGFHRVRAADGVLRRRPGDGRQEGRVPAGAFGPSGDDGPDAEHVRLPAGAEAGRVRQADSRARRRRQELAGEKDLPRQGPLRRVPLGPPFFMDDKMHDLHLERFYTIETIAGQRNMQDGPIKTFTLRGIKDSPPYHHDGRLLTLDDTVEFFNLVLDAEAHEQEKSNLVAYLRCL